MFPYNHPALFAMPLLFIVSFVVSKLGRSTVADRERAPFEDQFVHAQTGLGTAAVASH